MPPHLRTPDGRLYVITAPMRVGRDDANPIVLDDTRASRVHATVWPDGDVLCVRDEGSSNGTFVNEVRIPPGQVFGLRPGDGFRIGGTVFVVEAPGAVPPPQAAAPARPIIPPPGPTAAMTLPPANAQPRRSSLPMLAAGGCAALVVLLLCGAVGLLAVQRPPMVQTALAPFGVVEDGTPRPLTGPATVPPGEIRLTIVETSAAPTPHSPEAIAANQQSLAEAVAQLNQHQLELINLALAHSALEAPSGVPRLGRLLLQSNPINNGSFTAIEQDALNVLADAGALAAGMSAQDPGGDNGFLSQSLADAYAAVAQQAAGTVIKVDALRNKWNSGQITAADLAAQLAQASGIVWNPAVTQPGATGNPFVGLAADPAAVLASAPVSANSYSDLPISNTDPANAVGWVAVSQPDGEETIPLPPLAGPLSDPANPATLAELVASTGPVDPAALAQVAGTLLAAQAAPGDPAPTTVTIPKQGVIVADPKAANGQPLPGFPGGQVVVITQNPSANDLAGDLLGLDGNNNPTNNGQTPIESKPPVVTLTISNLTIQSVTKKPKDNFNSFEAEVFYSFDVAWTVANVTAPQFELDCAGGNHFVIASASGSQHVSAKGLLILYPGAEDAYCYASNNGNTWGSASVRFLVGDADGATQRANQVETDSVALNMTLTAEAEGTLAAGQTQAASTQAVLGTQYALETEVGASQTAEFAITITYIAQNEGNAATQTQAASQDTDGDGITDLNDRCVSQAETANGWRDDDGCADNRPTMNITEAGFSETLTGGPVSAFSTLANLTVDFNTGDSFGTLSGSATWSGSYFCYDTGTGDTIETVSASYDAFYTADVIGSADGAGRTFQADLIATGVTEITLTSLFTDETCTFLNDANLDDDWTGDGTVSGTWDGNTFGTLATNWTVDDIQIAGNWGGTITLTEN